MNEDERAERFASVYQECYPVVLAYARRRAEEHLARDVTAEVFLVAWRRLPEVPPAALPWLLGTARLVLANANRGQRRAERQLARSAVVDPPVPVPDHAEAVAERGRVMAALRQLTPSDQELLLLTAWEGLEPAEAAQVVGCSAATARVRLHRARRRMRAHLEAQPHLAMPQTPEPTTATGSTRSVQPTLRAEVL